jgi:hypothetical protein
MSAEMTIQFDPILAADLRRGKDSADANHVKEIAAQHGITLLPLHPQAEDNYLTRFYRATVDEARANEIIRQLRDAPGVQAAFVKPAGSAPKR